MKTAAATEGLPIAFDHQKPPTRFLDEFLVITITPNEACRVDFYTGFTDIQCRPVSVDTELIRTRQTLDTLANAVPNAFSQTNNATVSAALHTAIAPGEQL